MDTGSNSGLAMIAMITVIAVIAARRGSYMISESLVGAASRGDSTTRDVSG